MGTGRAREPPATGERGRGKNLDPSSKSMGGSLTQGGGTEKERKIAGFLNTKQNAKTQAGQNGGGFPPGVIEISKEGPC